MLEQFLTSSYFDLLLYIPALLLAIIVTLSSIFWGIKTFIGKNHDKQKGTGCMLVILPISHISIVKFSAKKQFSSKRFKTK